MSATAVVLYCLGAGLVVMTGLWAISIAIEDSSIVDPYWGAGFVLLGWTALALPVWEEGLPWPGGVVALVLAMVTVWGLRLSLHLARRNLGHGEDPRYTAMREKAGASWPLRSLAQVFWLQGAIMWIVGLPVLVTVAVGTLDASGGIEPLAWLGLAVWLVGMFFETVGDLQLSRFKADPAHRGMVMDRGLWAWTRHPNYFGDACVWWGIWVVAASAGHWWTFIGPALINFMLVRVSGAALLEKGMRKTRPGYAEYVARTSGFLPRPPRKP